MNEEQDYKVFIYMNQDGMYYKYKGDEFSQYSRFKFGDKGRIEPLFFSWAKHMEESSNHDLLSR